MTRPTTQQLAAAAESVLGISITVHHGRAAYIAHETSEGYWLSRADLRYALDCAAEHGPDAYSHWCAASGRRMSGRSLRSVFGS